MFCLTVVILRVVNGPLFDDTAGAGKVHDAYIHQRDGVKRVSLGDLHEETLEALKKLDRKPAVPATARRQQEIRNEMHIKGAAEKVLAASLPKHTAAGGAVNTAKASSSGVNVRTITVAKGDNLTKIVRRVYGCDVKQAYKYVKVVYEANSSVMKSPNDIKVGQKLLIPVVQSGNSSSLSKLAKMLPPGTFERVGTARSVTLSAKRYSTYRVNKGETLSDIAKNVLKDTSRWKEIFELNKNVLKSPDMVPAGVSLRMPVM